MTLSQILSHTKISDHMNMTKYKKISKLHKFNELQNKSKIFVGKLTPDRAHTKHCNKLFIFIPVVDKV